jgi:hypothetical protein
MIIIYPPMTDTSTTMNQNGGTVLFHSLDGKRNTTRGLLSLHHHDSSNRNDDSKITTLAQHHQNALV